MSQHDSEPAKAQLSSVQNRELYGIIPHGIHGAAIYGNMDPINIPQMLAYIPYMDPMGTNQYFWIITILKGVS